MGMAPARTRWRSIFRTRFVQKTVWRKHPVDKFINRCLAILCHRRRVEEKTDGGHWQGHRSESWVLDGNSGISKGWFLVRVQAQMQARSGSIRRNVTGLCL